MGAEELASANFILNAIQVGGLVGFMSVTIVAFVRGWVYPSSTVTELRNEVKNLTEALKINGAAADKMADAWEERNKQESEKARDELLFERLKRGAK